MAVPSTSTNDLYIGIMSGTSLDGIDVALARFSNQVEFVAHNAYPFSSEVRDLLYHIATTQQIDLDLFVRSHFLLARLYADAVNDTLKKNNLAHKDIRAIGLHGQTVRHLPTIEKITSDSAPIGATFQLGSGAAVAALTGIDTVSDFRSGDIALGGEGAPLVPMFDRVFLGSDDTTRIVLNIGGISNITVIAPTSSSMPVIAYDTGPGNMIIDELTRRYFHQAYDDNGEIASKAITNDQLLSEMLSHPYFQQLPPKSTGRELFGSQFLTKITTAIDSGVISATDAIRTATQLTARSIANEILRYQSQYSPSCDLIISGGGVYNNFLIHTLKELLPKCKIIRSDEFGIPSQAKEAIAFAFFAKAFLEKNIIHQPSTTGASEKIILGSLSYGKQ